MKTFLDLPNEKKRKVLIGLAVVWVIPTLILIGVCGTAFIFVIRELIVLIPYSLNLTAAPEDALFNFQVYGVLALITLIPAKFFYRTDKFLNEEINRLKK